ncbi:hypothetical protein [Marinobacter sp. ANT_B65]|uniref:hypothetical protein n=1 Tax=Marinobacter sp. ANT_B65 TaxID=2039467 RepID=UPI000BBED051|nr:hypothetical protein [Marinobacter sp. ANT_B65]PCM45863.1 hypothetical protein CPA50_07860 [Marinobacter sp. ANT_B65]
MKPIISICAPLVVSAFGLSGCQAGNVNVDEEIQESRWFNVSVFEKIDSIGDSYHDLVFDISYSDVDGNRIEVNDCLEVASLGDGKISEREFSRWDLLKTDCEAAMRFYNSPETAISFWPSKLDFSLLKKFPSTSIPYMGGQSLDGLTGDLASYESGLTLIESGGHSVKVSYDEMLVNYVEVARGDFNRDGYQDLFVRMDWYIEGALGSGNDWIVLTKLSPNAEPMMLWRK